MMRTINRTRSRSISLISPPATNYPLKRGTYPSGDEHAHSLITAGRLAVSDEFTVPLCAIHHAENHRTGKERRWWEERKIDPLAVAAQLWGNEKRIAPPDLLPGVRKVPRDLLPSLGHIRSHECLGQEPSLPYAAKFAPS
jgi:hypothetical protein